MFQEKLWEGQRLGGRTDFHQSYTVRAKVHDKAVFQLREICSLMSHVPHILTQMAAARFRIPYPNILIVAWYDHIKGGRSSLALLISVIHYTVSLTSTTSIC